MLLAKRIRQRYITNPAGAGAHEHMLPSVSKNVTFFPSVCRRSFTMASSYVQKVIRSVKKSNPHQPEFIQALCEVLESLEPLFEKETKYQRSGILERIVEPERQIMFRVA